MKTRSNKRYGSRSISSTARLLGSIALSRSRSVSRGRKSSRSSRKVATLPSLGRSRSRTRTKTKQRSDSDLTAQHANMAVQTVHIKLHKPQRFEKDVGKWSLYHTYSGCAQTSQTGNQLALEGPAVNSWAQLTTSTAANGVAITSSLGWANNPFVMNPYLAPTGGASLVQSQSNPIPDYVHLAGMQYSLSISSLTNLAQTVEVYWFLCKKNTVYSPVGNWNQALVDKSVGFASQINPSAVAGTGLVYGTPFVSTNGSGAGQTKITSNCSYGISPLSEKEFNMFWKKIGYQRFDLSSGDTKKLQVKIAYHKTISRAYLSTLPSTTVAVAGHTIIPMIVARAAPVYDTVSTTMTYGLAEIGYVAQQKMNFCVPKGNVGRLEYNRYSGQLIADSNVANTKFFNDVDALVSEITTF